MEYSALPAAARQSISIIDNLLLTAVDLTSVVQAMTVTIEDNAVLKTITAPAVGTALRYNAQLDIAIGGTGKSNKLSATHTCQVVGGALEDIIQPSLRSWRDYIMQHVVVQQVKIEYMIEHCRILDCGILSTGTSTSLRLLITNTFSLD